MRYSILMMSAVGLALLASGIPASAQDVEELERRALALKKEAAELFEKGREDEAHGLERKSEGLLLKVRQLVKQEKSGQAEGNHKEKSGADSPDRQHLKQLLHDLRAAREQAEERKAPEQEQRRAACFTRRQEGRTPSPNQSLKSPLQDGCKEASSTEAHES